MHDGGLNVRGLAVAYGRAHHPVLSGIDLHVARARTLAIVGPSGAGKSTLLRAIAGLVATSAGTISIDARSLANVPARLRRVAVVFAHDALVPHLSVRENLAFALRRPDAGRIVELARALAFEPYLDRRPRMLSTGERQRVAIARALLSDPEVLLLDEPLAPLDPALRVRVRDDLVHVRDRFEGPIVFVTHDHADAMAVGDDLAVLIDGRVEDIGDPQRVYDCPATMRSAAVLGIRPMNVLPGSLAGFADSVVAGIRPERVRLTEDAPLRGRVLRIERTGADAYVHVAHADLTLLARVDPSLAPPLGGDVGIALPSDAVVAFDRATGARA